MSETGYRLLPHTADVALQAWGPSLEDAYAAAVRGLIAVTFDVRRIRRTAERRVGVTASTSDRLLVRLLNEVLYLQDATGFLTGRARVTMTEDGLSADLRGETYSPARHRRTGPQVKAITFHDLSIDVGPPTRIHLILDI